MRHGLGWRYALVFRSRSRGIRHLKYLPFRIATRGDLGGLRPGADLGSDISPQGHFSKHILRERKNAITISLLAFYAPAIAGPMRSRHARCFAYFGARVSAVGRPVAVGRIAR
jgi:hypothetical protein